MGLRAKTFAFLNRYVPILIGRDASAKEIYYYGLNNLLPNENLKLINDSGIAKKSAAKLSRYIQSDGFADQTTAKFKVNSKQTADQLLAEISSYVAYNKGFALTIQRNLDGQIVGVQSIPFECIRKRKDGNFIYNPMLGQKQYTEKETTNHPAYFGLTPSVEQLSMIASPVTIKDGKEGKNEFYHNLEILYVFEKTADNPNYPVPDYYAGIEDIRTSIELQGLDLDTVRNGFMTSAILVVPKMDSLTKDEAGKTESDYFDEAISAMTGNVKDANGYSKRNAVTVIEVASMEDAPKFMPWDSKVLVEASINKRDQIERSVARWMGVPPSLVGFADAAILGNSQAIANASKDLTDFVNPLQRMISGAFKQIYPTMDWTITQFTFWDNISSDVWAVMTPDEKRNTAGLPPIEKEVTNESRKVIDSINSLSPLVANKVLESMSPDEVRGLVGLQPKIINQPISTNGVSN